MIGYYLATPPQVSYGGPIIAFQVENEYTAFGNDSAYMQAIHDVGGCGS